MAGTKDKDYGFEDDYAEYEGFDSQASSRGSPQPKSTVKYKEVKSKRQVH